MALDKATLKADLETLLTKPVGQQLTPAAAAQALADAIEKFVKTGTVDISTIGPGTFSNSGGPVAGTTSATGGVIS